MEQSAGIGIAAPFGYLAEFYSCGAHILRSTYFQLLKVGVWSFAHLSFEFSDKYHDGQLRKSGEPYIIHPMEVVKILISLRADKHTLMAGFLHDILEDTETKPEEIKELFGEEEEQRSD